MGAGELRERVILQQKLVAMDDYGQEIETWSDVAILWAAIMSLRGSEFYDAQSEQSEDIQKFKIRYRQDVRRDMRIMHKADSYEITRIAEVPPKKYLELTARAFVT
jgi:SPP1 family predicted phage head-tail adaptor